ncbi:unnamed protein product [Clonostachys byssicola]|uniref:Metallo-beta-lactamase domain-containing protein n=1 Tax=Clonostachys byssicola TaxID=160290 RepID=A0A9N9XW24_9HYPO|nr:unnamed protein product [Clonostachys byssicola]
MRIQINLSQLPAAQRPDEPDFNNIEDFDNASRGFIAKLEPCIIRDAKGHVVWDNDAYDFVKEECPNTVNPKLWRQAQLTAIQGLYEVSPAVYQVRGFDISNMSIVEGQSGIIVIDPLTSMECAQEALKFYRKNRGNRPVTAVIYSHSHADHYGGALGVLPKGTGSIPIIAPEGFMKEVTSEHVLAGPSMLRRAAFMYGTRLPKHPRGQVGTGLGMAASAGTTSIIPPNTLVTKTGQELVIDGVKFVFQLVPGTEAPAELNFFLPDHEALYISECATHCLHNIITLRGASVRDARAWSQYLDETVELYGERSKVLFAGHHWPTWGQDKIKKLVSEQRDMYAFLHDQTVRLMNKGLTGTEIAEILALPPKLRRAWHAQGYYGSVSHNVKGIYQRYMTWFDGNPAHLWPHTPSEEGKRYIRCFGGVEELVSKAQVFIDEGDLRFAATLLDHAVSAEPDNRLAAETLAYVFEKMGFAAENATWRNFFLTRAMDLRNKSKSHQAMDTTMVGVSLNPDASIEDWLDAIAVSVDGPRAAEEFEESQSILVRVLELESTWKITLSNGAMTYRSFCRAGTGVQQANDFERIRPAITFHTKEQLHEILSGKANLSQFICEGLEEHLVLQRLLELSAITT